MGIGAAVGAGLGGALGLVMLAVTVASGTLGVPGRLGRLATGVLAVGALGASLLGGGLMGAAWTLRPAAEATLVGSELGARTVAPIGASLAEVVRAAAAAAPGVTEDEAVARRDGFRTGGLPLAELDSTLAAWSAAAASGETDRLEAELDPVLRRLVAPDTAERLRTVLPQLAEVLRGGSSGPVEAAWRARDAYAARDGIPERLAPDELSAWCTAAIVVPAITAPVARVASALTVAAALAAATGWALVLAVALLARRVTPAQAP